MTSSLHPAGGLILAAAGAYLAVWPGAPAGYALPKLVVLGFGAASAWLALLSSPAAARSTHIDKPLAALAAAFLVSAVFSHDRWLSFLGKSPLYHGGALALILCAVLFYAAAAVSKDEDARRWIIRSILISSSAAALAAFAIDGWRERLGGLSGSPVFLGATLLIAVPLGLHFILDEKGRDRALGAAALLLSAAAVGLTLSRGAWLGAISSCALYAALRKPAKLGNRLALAILAAALLLPAVFMTQVRGASMSDRGRSETWKLAASVAAEHPVTGYGPATFSSAARKYRGEGLISALGARHAQDHAHNDFLEAAATWGLLGLAAYLWLLFSAAGAFTASLKDSGRRAFTAAAAGAAAGLFFQAKFNPAPPAALALIALLCGLAFPSRGLGSKTGRIAAVAALAACLLSLFWTIRLARADALIGQSARISGSNPMAALQAMEKARGIDPSSIEARAHYHAYLLKMLPRAGSKEQAGQMLSLAADLGRETIARHPNDAAGHLMLGYALLQSDDAAGAERALAEAEKLDPHFLPALEARLGLALLMKEDARAKKLQERINEIRSWQPAERPS